MMANKLVQIVDDNDQPLFGATKERAIAEHLNRRLVRVMLVDGKGNVLLQKRAPTKHPYPNRWDNSVAGHVDEGESYEQAAHREIEEEVGLSKVPIVEIGSNYVARGDNGELQAFVKVYKALITGLPTKLSPREVTEVKWFNIKELRKLIKDGPEAFTDGLRRVVTEYFEEEF
jgi:isopentenyldiphosphate isomerase